MDFSDLRSKSFRPSHVEAFRYRFDCPLHPLPLELIILLSAQAQAYAELFATARRLHFLKSLSSLTEAEKEFDKAASAVILLAPSSIADLAVELRSAYSVHSLAISNLSELFRYGVLEDHDLKSLLLEFEPELLHRTGLVSKDVSVENFTAIVRMYEESSSEFGHQLEKFHDAVRERLGLDPRNDW